MKADNGKGSGGALRASAGFAKWAVLAFFLVAALLPLVWLVINSFRTNLELETSPLGFPTKISLQNYRNAIVTGDLGRLLLNSVIAAIGSVSLNLIVASMASFILSREKFRGRDAIYTIATAGVLIPIVSFMVPYFWMITKTGLYDKLLSLILTYAAINLPVSISLITTFMRAIPKELEEAAIIDGCGFNQRFAKIIFPLSRSGLATAGTFCFIYAWNEFVMAMLFTSSVSSRTIQLGIRYFTSQFITDYTGMFAAIVLSIIPSILVYVFLHDKIISGLTAGAVKG
ncbi:MAG: carbohydrate ABC transporter permease [Spirochaetales bacterium]